MIYTDAAENHSEEVTDANTESPISMLAYETLHEMRNEDDSAYTEPTRSEWNHEAIWNWNSRATSCKRTWQRH